MSEKEPLKIVNTDRIDGEALIVIYSNDTTAIYTTEQIAGLAPLDIRLEEDRDAPQNHKDEAARLPESFGPPGLIKRKPS